ncbi:MAG TPA: NAD(P)-dependent oxidoreductase [Trueperaceae bacterium]|nr:NAD(P)-dependent oxidoreductase [Trueperaceae bacterium]
MTAVPSSADDVPGSVALIGIGAMGRGFARHFLDAGYTVRGFDVDPARLTEFASWGGVPTGSASEAARGAAWVVTSLPKHEHVRDVLFGDDGVRHGSHPGQLVIDTSTSLPDQSRDLATELAPAGVRFLDASVSGTGATVMHKDVVVLVGGSDTDFHDAQALLQTFSRRTYHLGPVGSGALGKLIINVVVVGNRLALAEGLNFGMASGMNTDVLLQILKDGPTYSRAMDLKGEKMISGDYTPESTLSQSLAGTSLLLAQAQELGVPLFLTALYSQIAQAGVNLGFGPADPAALIEALKAMSRKDG